jgi:hypothetical protein
VICDLLPLRYRRCRVTLPKYFASQILTGTTDKTTKSLLSFASARTGLAHAHILEHLVMMIQIDTSSAVLLTPPCLGEKQLRSKTSMLNDSVACPALSAGKCRMGSAEKDDGGQWSFEGVGAFKFKHRLPLPLPLVSARKLFCSRSRFLTLLR